MRIGIDYTAAVRQGGGIGRYTRNLIRAVAELDRTNSYRLFVAGGRAQKDADSGWPETFRVRSLPLSDRWTTFLWQRLRLPVPIQTVTGSLDLFHSPDFVLPPTGRASTILTVHDLSFLRVPQYFVPGFCAYLERAVSRAVRRADHILADSQSTRQDLIDLLAVEPQRVTVLYPGVEPRFQPIHDAEVLERVRSRYNLPAQFVLGIGTLQPRKNFEGLIEAFGHLLADRGDIPDIASLHLVIGGGKGWMYEKTLNLPDQLGLAERVHFLGFVDDGDLPALYNMATVLAFPSWYEGFGLPVLEAMACGTPVVTAGNSSLPEAAGNAALIVDAAETRTLVEALSRSVVDVLLRQELVAAGLKQARGFTWPSAARQLLDIYQSIAGAKP